MFRNLTRFLLLTFVAGCGDREAHSKLDLRLLAEEGFPDASDDRLITYDQIPKDAYDFESAFLVVNAKDGKATVEVQLHPDADGDEVESEYRLDSGAEEALTRGWTYSSKLKIPFLLRSGAKTQAEQIEQISMTVKKSETGEPCSITASIDEKAEATTPEITQLFSDSRTKKIGKIYHLRPTVKAFDMRQAVKRRSDGDIILYRLVEEENNRILGLFHYVRRNPSTVDRYGHRKKKN